MVILLRNKGAGSCARSVHRTTWAGKTA